MMNEDLLAELEQKWLNGTITEDEMALYAEWYNDRQNEAFNVPEAIAVNQEEHRLKVLHSIEMELSKEDPVFHRNIAGSKARLFIRVAMRVAAILLVVVAGIFLFNKIRTDKQKNLADLPPGRSGLVLTIDNGQVIQLDTVKDGLVLEREGIKILKRDDMIWYEGKSNKIFYNTATTTAGRKYHIILPDGSSVWLNAGSEIKYPIAFTKDNRTVSMKGEAYFDIASSPLAPFIVDVKGMKVEVLGTKFSIKAYENDPEMATTLIDGKVRVKTANSQKILQPNETAVKPVNSEFLEFRDVQAGDAVGWMNNKFVFENMKLEDVMKAIERWYDIPVIIEDGVDKNMVFSGSTPMNQNLSEILKVLALSGINCTLTDGTLVVKP